MTVGLSHATVTFASMRYLARRFLLLLLLLFAPALHANGVTLDPTDSASSATGSTGSGASPDGTTSGGFTGNNSPLSGLYNATLGTGIKADPYAPASAQTLGQNGYQTANGSSSGTTKSGDPVNMVPRPPVRRTFPTSAASDFLSV